MKQTTGAELRETILREMKTYASILRQLHMDQQADSMEAKIAEYDQGLFQVLFTGGFSAGKSTTLNALTRRQLLKTSVKPETAVFTKIVNGKNSSMVTVTYRDLERPDTVMPYDQFKEEFRLDDENSEKFKEVAYVTVTNEMRNKSIALVDSPGLSHTKQDNAIANDFADRADAIVFLLNATQLWTEDEQEYIEKHFAYKGLRNVFFVANWYNSVKPEDEEGFRVQLKNVIGSAFKSEDGTFDEELYKQRVFLVDAYTSECARTGQNKKIRKETRKSVCFIEEEVPLEKDEETGVPQFERALFGFLETPERVKEVFRDFLPQMEDYYYAQNEAMVKQVVKIIENRISDLEQEMGFLADKNMRWIQLLRGQSIAWKCEREACIQQEIKRLEKEKQEFEEGGRREIAQLWGQLNRLEMLLDNNG